LVTEVERTGSYDVSLAMLLAAPTIAQLAAAMLGGADSDSSETVVCVRSGAGRPIFWVHSVTGNVMECLTVILSLKNPRPIYGIHAKGLRAGEEPLTSVREMASSYIREIRSIQPNGPYTLLGYSFGGLVAFEMAHQLHRSGESIEMLGLLDTHVHEGCLPWSHRIRYQMQFAMQQWRMFRDVQRAQRVHYISKKLAGAVDRVRLQFGKMARNCAPDLAHLPPTMLRVREAMRAAMAVYRLPSYDAGPVQFIRAALPVGDLCNPMPAWQRAARRGLDVSRVGGSHVEMIIGRNAELLAATLDRLLRQAQARKPRS
jgi:acetoacetyl-CoA synthetase